MAFLPGLSENVSKAYTVLDDIIAAAEKGHNLVSLLSEFASVVSAIFHHSRSGDLQLSLPIEPPLPVPPPAMATLREEKISRDLQPE